MSHSHGWSSGPTSALTEFVLGLSVTSPAGAAWKLAPQFGDLTQVEGGFVTSLGKYWAGWRVQRGGYVLSFETPVGTVGEVVLPCLEAGKVPSIFVDGRALGGRAKMTLVGDDVMLEVSGGSHSFAVR